MGVQNTLLTQDNVFNLSEAVKAEDELALPAILQHPREPKAYEALDNHVLFGKGPAVYFNCTERLNCKLDVSGST